MVSKTIGSRLRRLFSTQVVVRKVGKKRLKIVDSSKLQSDGNQYASTNVYDRFKRVFSSKPYRQGGYIFQEHNQSERMLLYDDYDSMDSDPIPSSVLDIFSDEVTIRNEWGDMIDVVCDDENIKQILYNLLYDILNIDYNLWPWVRNLCKYGDYFLYLDLDEEIGVKNVVPIPPHDMERYEGLDGNNPYEVTFKYQPVRTNSALGIEQESFEYHQIAHFRLQSDMNFLPYGRSILEPGRKMFKMLTLMEDAMLLFRIMRAPERRIFKIDVGNLPPEEVDSFIQTIKDSLKKDPYIDENTGEYNLKFNLLNSLEDIFLPKRGDNVTEIETLPGLGNENQIEDIEYVRHKLMAAFKVPNAFLNYDENAGGKNLLSAQDIYFARTVERIQKLIESELTKIAIIHLYIQGYRNSDLASFEIKLSSPSTVYERQKIELLTEQLNLARELKESKMFSERYIYENIFGLSANEWRDIRDEVFEDLKIDFVRMQIEQEGNDPRVTHRSFGTPHDIASLQMSVKEVAAEAENGSVGAGGDNAGNRPKGEVPTSKTQPPSDETRGRKPELKTFNTGRGTTDYDADGSKSNQKALKPDNTKLLQRHRGGVGPIGKTEVRSGFISYLSRLKSPEIIKESIIKNNVENVFSMLDDSQIEEI